MKIAIVAASGQTGTQLIEQALAAGHEVIGLARTPENIKSNDPRVTKRHGDAFDEQSIVDGLEGADAVITSVGKRDLFDKRYKLSTIAHAAVLKGMAKHGIRRLVVISSTGAAQIKRDGIRRNIYLFLRRKYYADMYQMELQVLDNDYDVTVVRAPFLVDGEADGDYFVEEREHYPVGINITRANLAQFLVNETMTKEWNRRVIAVVGNAD
ncbi:MAG: NAD(P)H-binding protein [Gammaproteobacteria bacterium]|nr:NAD(P)H-binding protein [Gammaproteobacteria bacterium]NND53471.1 NAD(P)H-binding protein [Gammaproteobacteria bacterium]